MKRDRLWCRSLLLSSTWTKSNHPSFIMISNQVKIRWFLALKHWDFHQLISRKYSADRRLRERWHQNHGFRSIQNHGFWKLQSRPWHGFDVARSRNLLVLATRMLCGGQNAAKNLFKSWRLVARCHLLPMSLWQKGNTLHTTKKEIDSCYHDGHLLSWTLCH